jgi:cytoskeletal protein RodZ
MIFEKKKIQIETLSEYLTSVRQNLGLSLEEVGKKTGIKLKFLQSLESGDFKPLPAEVYVFGFLRQLSQLYLVQPFELIEQYKKEKGIQQQQIKQAMEGHSWHKKYFGGLVITPKILTLAVGLLFVGVTAGYIVWQVWSINKTPSLNVTQPTENQSVQQASIQVTGTTDPGMSVSVNGDNIFVDSGGAFQTQVGISQGPDEIVVAAENHFGKSVSKTINVIGSGGSAATSSPVVLKVDFTAPVVLSFIIDDQAPQTLNFSGGDSKTFTADRRIILSTSDAGSTKVTLNGQALGAMGKPKEQLSNIPFFSDPAVVNGQQ